MMPEIRWHFCRQILKHYWNATRIDVLHSPFVFKIYNTCIRRKSNPGYEVMERLTSGLRRNRSEVIQLDYGTTPPIERRSTIAKLSRLHAKPRRIALILSSLIREFGYKSGIELGTSLGISTCYQGLAFRQQRGKLVTIEGAPALSVIARENFKTLQLEETIEAVTGRFEDILPEILQQFDTLDYAFIDGNHRYEPTISYFHQLLSKMHNNSIMIFDDIHWSEGMTKAWNEIKTHPQVTVTIDLFFIGLVFFRKEQAKQHFRLRIF